MSFATIAEKKRIQLKFIPDQHDIPVYFSKDTIEKIFYNLISNAFKFTPPGGTIEVSISGRTNNIGIKSHCLISVKDSGIGIPENELSKVFTKFYQVSSAAKYSDHGSGIGLALVKELVELHYGEVKVESRLNEGTTFSVLLPLGKDHLKPDELVQVDEKLSAIPSYLAGYQSEVEDNSLLSDKNIIRNSPEVQNGETLIVLVVEDNTNVRKYISEYLGETYRILEADNGRDGFELAIDTIPDIIISDVMMPGMNGYDLCRKLKTDERTSHIPVILLTAKAGDADKMEGLETGADDYLTKPFNSKELLIRVKNLIEIRQKLRKKFSSSLVIKPKEITSSSIDKLFIAKALLVVEQNISNENFSVMDLSSKMNLSHSQLHRKLKALLNKSANQFIRSVKMQKALELLKSKAGTIAEIGYQVGYNDPSYFTRAFSTHFGYLPSEVKRDE
jgi:DNA-binding response OmpR family regulator